MNNMPLNWTGKTSPWQKTPIALCQWQKPCSIKESHSLINEKSKIFCDRHKTTPCRQIPAAAGLIQCLWRCYAADKSFYSKVFEDYLAVYDHLQRTTSIFMDAMHASNDVGAKILMNGKRKTFLREGNMEDRNFLMGRQHRRSKLSFGRATWQIKTCKWEGNMADKNFLMERQHDRSRLSYGKATWKMKSKNFLMGRQRGRSIWKTLTAPCRRSTGR